ncbi:B-box zinc finger protein [uncultured Pseudoteredinibacter sp.]|uniref:B-box zinc finger protein n=1 Tax=uncultured Pseudoteredinibacter sp. TaxID=1641701 RepID=UPI002638F5EB|nr:B-box zinc finger protein [uncultured Pseudoteredinibacter sp.]
MSYCRYHPTEAASYYCESCHYHACKHCSNDSDSFDEQSAQCFLCKRELSSLGASLTAEPFWRRIGKAFRYALGKEALTALIITALIALLGIYIPLVNLIALAFLYKYCFFCLEQTAHGNMKAPDVAKASSGGLQILLQIIGLLILSIGSTIIISAFLGVTLAVLWMIFMAAALPAAFMILSINKDFSQAINPQRQLEVMAAIGPSYFLLLMLLFIMMSSVGLLHWLIGEQFSTLGQLSSTFVSNYYSVVMFHLMGYVVFQYQDKLGIVAQQQDENKNKRSDKQKLDAKLGMLLKDGDYQAAVQLMRNQLARSPIDGENAERLLNLLIELEDKETLAKVSEDYFAQLFITEQHYKIGSRFKQLKVLIPDYRPQKMGLRLQLAQHMDNSGDFKQAALLLKNFHKESQDKRLVVEAYELMVNCLNKLPNGAQQAQPYQHYVANIKKELEALEQSKPASLRSRN